MVAKEVKHLAARTANATDHIMDELNSINQAVGEVQRLCRSLVKQMHAAVALSRSVGANATSQAMTRIQIGGEIEETVMSAKSVGHHAAKVGQASSALLSQAASLREHVRRAAA